MKIHTLLSSLLLGAGLFVSALAAPPVYMSVQLQEGVLRQTASSFAKPVARLKYADLVEVLGANGAWYQVRSYGYVQGWLHQSALTKKQLVAGAGGGQAAVRASSSEVALAGKGFNSDIEAKFRADNQTMDFKTIDQMEKTRVSEEESLQFLREGGLRPKGAAL